MKKVATYLWIVYILTGLPLTAFGIYFTGGGLPDFVLLDDYSDPILVLVWLFGTVTIFFLPIAALIFTILSLRR